jgi:hypothetical protein
MDEKLLKRYLGYANTEESFAVIFAKKYLTRAKGHWVDIIDSRPYERSSDKLHFRFVKGALYKRKIKPQYPSKATYTINGKFDEHKYYLMVRAITWETAHRDIEQQKLKNVTAIEFEIKGVSYDKNRSNKNYFSDDAPQEIKALAQDLNNRTNPLWDKAIPYINKAEFVYKIKNVRIKSV